MAFKLTFAGVPFRQLHPDHAARLRSLSWLQNLRDVLPERIWPGPNLSGLGAPQPLPYPSVELNQWFYPVGASRTSIFRGVMTGTDVAAIKASWGTSSVYAQFIIQNEVDAVGSNVTDLYLLPPMPIRGTDDDPDLNMYLVTLVDERYYWPQLRNSGRIRGSGATATWANVLDQLATALGITLTYAAVDAVYGSPEADSALYSNFENPAVLIDMVAANVGGVIVRNLDGSYKLQRWEDAQAAQEDNRLDVTAMGGAWIDVDAEAYKATMPASVTVVFPKWVDGTGYHKPDSNRGWRLDSYPEVWTKNVTLAALGVPYSGYANNGGIKILHTTAKARFTLAADAAPNNATAVDALATELAKDFYKSRTAWLDEAYRGILPVVPEGMNDLLFHFAEPHCYTRILPPPFNWGLRHFQHGFGAVAVPSSVAITVKEVDGTPSYADVSTILFDQVDGFVVSQPAATQARIDLSSASATQKGAVDLAAQVMGDGPKEFQESVQINTSFDASVASLRVWGPFNTVDPGLAAGTGGIIVGGSTDPGAADIFGELTYEGIHYLVGPGDHTNIFATMEAGGTGANAPNPPVSGQFAELDFTVYQNVFDYSLLRLGRGNNPDETGPVYLLLTGLGAASNPVYMIGDPGAGVNRTGIWGTGGGGDLFAGGICYSLGAGGIDL